MEFAILQVALGKSMSMCVVSECADLGHYTPVNFINTKHLGYTKFIKSIFLSSIIN